MQFERKMPFKLHKIIYFFPEKKIKYVYLPYLIFSELLPKAHLLFYLALLRASQNLSHVNKAQNQNN